MLKDIKNKTATDRSATLTGQGDVERVTHGKQFPGGMTFQFVFQIHVPAGEESPLSKANLEILTWEALHQLMIQLEAYEQKNQNEGDGNGT